MRNIFGNLLPLLRNITVLFRATWQRLYLHLAVRVGHEVLLGHLLILRELSTYHRRLLHVAPGSALLPRRMPTARRILLDLIHLINQHHVFHI